MPGSIPSQAPRWAPCQMHGGTGHWADFVCDLIQQNPGTDQADRLESEPLMCPLVQPLSSFRQC